MRRLADAEVQVAGLSAVRPLFSFAGHPDARSVPDACRNPDIDRAGVAVVLDGKPAHGASVGVFERQLELLFHVAALPRSARACAAAAPPFVAAPRGPAEEGVEEIGERVL